MKRVFSLMLCLALVFGLGAGTLAAQLNEPGTYPISNETIKLTILMQSKPYIEDYNTNDFTKYLEDLMGLDLEFSVTEWETAKERVNLLMTGGDYPDILMMLQPDVVKFGVQEGMFLPLNDLIEKNMPNLMANFGKEKLETLKQSDGNIYGLPVFNEAYHVMYGDKVWANTHVLEQMGLKVPTTIQELYDVSEAYMKANPKGMAIIDNTEGEFINFIMNSFILTPSVTYGSHDKINAVKCVLSPEGKVTSIVTTEQYKEGLKFIKSLYDMGAYYDGSFSGNRDTLTNLINQEGEPVLFFPSLYSGRYISSASSNELYRHYNALSPIAGPEGVRRTPFYYHAGIYENQFVITDACKNPEAALRFIDWFYTPKSYVMASFGTEEGKDFIWMPEGMNGINGKPALYQLLNPYTTEVQNHDWQVTGGFYATSDVRLGEAAPADLDKYAPNGLELYLYTETRDKFAPYGPQEGDYNILPVMHLKPEEQLEVSVPLVEVANYIAQSQTAFINGTLDIDAEWDNFIKKLDTFGLQTILNTYQAVVDRSAK